MILVFHSDTIMTTIILIASLEAGTGSAINQRANTRTMQRKHPASPSSTKFRTQPLTGKVTLTVFWDSQGPVTEDYQERGTTVTSVRYGDM
jgi:hypothetical protein